MGLEYLGEGYLFIRFVYSSRMQAQNAVVTMLAEELKMESLTLSLCSSPQVKQAVITAAGTQCCTLLVVLHHCFPC